MVRRDSDVWDEALEWYGERIAIRRLSAGMTQRALASWAGISQSTLSRIEHGLLRGTRLEVIARLEQELATRGV